MDEQAESEGERMIFGRRQFWRDLISLPKSRSFWFVVGIWAGGSWYKMDDPTQELVSLAICAVLFVVLLVTIAMSFAMSWWWRIPANTLRDGDQIRVRWKVEKK